MIAPYQHVPSISDLDPETLTDLMVTAQRCLAALQAAMGPQGYNMGINQGAAAGAGIADHVAFPYCAALDRRYELHACAGRCQGHAGISADDPAPASREA